MIGYDRTDFDLSAIDFGGRRKAGRPMPFRGGHGRTPGATDSRQGRARGETYLSQTKSGLLVVLLVVLLVPGVFVAGLLLFDPTLRPWGLGGLAIIVVVVTAWRRVRRARTTSLEGMFTDLGED